MILTLSGASGSGKTTIAKALLEQVLNTRLLRSYTTRSPRPSDILSEFTYIDQATFASMKGTNEFLWAADFGSTSVGTRIEDLENAIKDERKIWIMILVPEVLPKLYTHAKSMKKEGRLKSVFIESECDEVLQNRMAKRGDSESQIQERIKLCRPFEEEAKLMKIPFIWVKNNKTIQEAVNTVEKAIGTI